ncbi:MAG: dehydratase [Phyllobacteriaceae bacterium]|nr:dehydratase [Phyllobacteriaceae bacterium]
MMGLFLEEFTPGQVFPLGSYTFTAENIRAYSTAFAPVGFHMNADQAEKGLFGKTAAAGFHTCSGWMSCFVASNSKARAQRADKGEALPEIGPSPGIAKVRWPRPVHAGEAISYHTRVVAARLLNSRPGWGMVTFLNEGHNPKGDVVMSFEGKVLVQARSP